MNENKKTSIPGLKIGDIETELPIIQGGMSVGISLSELAASVAEAGGIGVIGAAGIGMLEDDFDTNFKKANKRALIKEIRKARQKTDGPIGVNLMVALNDFGELVSVAVKEKIDLLFLGAGLPLRNIPIEEINRNNTKIVPIVS